MSELPPTTTTPDTNGRLMRRFRFISALGTRAVHNLLGKLGDRFDNHPTQLDQSTASTTGPIDFNTVRKGNPDMDLLQIYTAAAVANLIGRLLSGHKPTNHPRTGR